MLLYMAVVESTTVRKGERTRSAILDVAARLARGRASAALDRPPRGGDRHEQERPLRSLRLEARAPARDRRPAAPVFTRRGDRAGPRGAEGRRPGVGAVRPHAPDSPEVFPGGCFFAATSFEYNNRPGPVRDRIAEMMRLWIGYLERAVEQAQEAGELTASPSARELAFQLDAFAQAANARYQLFGDGRVRRGAARDPRAAREPQAGAGSPSV